MFGPELTHWTIRLALIGFAAGITLMIFPGVKRQFGWFRAVWTIGCVCFLAHVICAFHYFYRWSHVVAVKQTGIETEQLIGVTFGNGIWFNYLFAVVWLIDVAWTWLAPESYRQRSRWWMIGMVGYLSFIAVQGSVVFETGMVRFVSAIVTIALIGLLIFKLTIPLGGAEDLERRPRR